MRLLFVTILSFSFFCYCSTPTDEIELRIVNGEIRLNRDNPQIKIDFEIINNSNVSYIMYGFGYLSEAIYADSFYCSPNIVAGSSIFIFNKDGDQIFPWYDISPPEELDYKPITPRILTSIHDMEKQKLYNYKEVIFSNDVKRQSFYTLLEYHKLEPGEYDLQVIYYSGDNLKNYFNVDEIEEDENAFNVRRFKGCIKSNIVTLVVE